MSIKWNYKSLTNKVHPCKIILSYVFKDSARKARRSRGGEEAAAAASPPGYVQNLVNKILSNVQVGIFYVLQKVIGPNLAPTPRHNQRR